MKKLIALLLSAMLALGCASAFAEATVIESSNGQFTVSFQLPEGVELLSGEWEADGSMYRANIRGTEGLYFYMAVAAPRAGEGDEDEETAPVTYNEESGYTDEYIKSMLDDMFADDSDNYDKGVQTTAYGTKLAVIRFNDPEAPYAYIFSVWNGYEVGVTVTCVDADGLFRAVTDDQVQRVTDFLSEVWMNVSAAETPAA